MWRNYRYWAVVLVALAIAGLYGLRAAGEPKDDFRFSILGDRTGSATPEIFGRVWREINLFHPDFVVTVGDAIQGGNDAQAPAQWREVRAVLERYARFPVYFTPGNHDIWSDASRRLYEKETGRPPFYSFSHQNAHFVILDNSRTSDLSEEQLAFLEKDLKANPASNPKFVFLHKPYWLVPLALGSGDFPLHRIARKYGVNYVISGHTHQFARMVRDGVIYMVVGSSGARLSENTAPGSRLGEGLFYHHLWVRVKGADAFFIVKELDGPAGQGRMFRAEDWDVRGPQFDPKDPAAKDRPET